MRGNNNIQNDKVRLAKSITEQIRRKGLTQEAAGAICETERCLMNRIVKLDLDRFSLQKLITVAQLLDIDVSLHIDLGDA